MGSPYATCAHSGQSGQARIGLVWPAHLDHLAVLEARHRWRIRRSMRVPVARAAIDEGPQLVAQRPVGPFRHCAGGLAVAEAAQCILLGQGTGEPEVAFSGTIPASTAASMELLLSCRGFHGLVLARGAIDSLHLLVARRRHEEAHPPVDPEVAASARWVGRWGGCCGPASVMREIADQNSISSETQQPVDPDHAASVRGVGRGGHLPHDRCWPAAPHPPSPGDQCTGRARTSGPPLSRRF